MQREIDMLEQEIVLLSHVVRYPPAPDLAAAVVERASARRDRAPVWRLAAIATASLAAVALAVAAIAPARQAVADLFHRINIFQTKQLPPGLTYDVEGREVSRQEAENALGFRLALPAGQEPSRLLLQEFGEWPPPSSSSARNKRPSTHCSKPTPS